MPELLPFFVVLLAAVFFSGLFSRLHLPWVVALLIGGILIGPHAFDLVELDSTLEVMGEIGLVFLMFMAGLETRLSSVRHFSKNIITISLLNSLIPFAMAMAVGLYFDYSITASILLGIIFMSSSIAVVIPSLEANGLLRSQLGQTIVASTMIEDVMSLIALSVLLQVASPTTSIPLPIFYLILVIALLIIRFVIVKIEKYFSSGPDAFENQLRLTFAILIGTVVIFELIGLHAIIAGFFAGFVLSRTMRSMKTDVLKEKLHAISYGLFIPIFFIVIGTKTDISVFSKAGPAISLTLIILGSSLISKLLSGFMAGKISKFTNRESALIGFASTPQLSTTLAVAFTGFELGILDENIVTAMVVLSVVTTFVAPVLIQIMGRKSKPQSAVMAK